MSRTKKPKVIHFRDKCIGCGACTLVSPKHWELSDKDGKASLTNAKESKKGIWQKEINPGEIEENKDAEDNCPVKIIQVRDY